MTNYRANAEWFSEFLADIVDDEGSLASMRDYIPDTDETDTPTYHDYIILVDGDEWDRIEALSDADAYADAIDTLNWRGWPTSDAVVTVKRAA